MPNSTPTRRPRRAAPAGSNRRPTLAEVAKASGVAVSTVSHILNDRPSCYASKATRQRVTDAARRLGYRPNLAARGLRSGSTSTLGFITTALDVEVAAGVVIAAEQAARQHGYLAIMSFNPNDQATEDRLILLLRDHCVDGMLVIPCEYGQHEELRALAEANCPVVTIDGAGRFDFDIDDVTSDFAAGGRMQAQHLLERGRRRVCYASSVDSCRVIDLRRDAFCQVMAEAGAPPVVMMNLEVQQEPSIKRGVASFEQIRHFLSENRGRFDAVAAAGDTYGLATIKAAYSLGISVPRELAVIGYDGTISADNTPIPLTTIESPTAAVGAAAYELLAEQLGNERRKRRQVALQPKLVVRTSTTG